MRDADFYMTTSLFVPSSYSWDTAGTINIVGCSASLRGFAFLKSVSNNIISLGNRTPTGNETVSDFTIQRDTWYHFVATYEASTKTACLYVNGVFIASKVLVYTDFVTTPIRITGYSYSGTPASIYFTGRIKHVRFGNKILSAEEVLYLYNNPDVAIPADATVVYYEDDAVLSTATATMEWTERYIGL